MASTDITAHVTLAYVEPKRLYCAATNCTHIIADTRNKVFGPFDTSLEPHKKVHIDVTVYLCDECMERVRQGNSPRYTTPAVNPFEEANEAFREAFGRIRGE